MNKYAHLAQSITDSLTMKAVAEHYGLTFNKAGFAVCPFHPEKTASFKIDGQYGHCFGCGWNHGMIRFVMDLCKISFQAAVEKLNGDFSLNLPINRRLTLREQRQAEQRRAELMRQRAEQDAAKRAYESMYWSLWDEWIRLDINSRKHDWTDPTEPPSEEYAEAVKMMCVAEYRIDSEL